MIFEQSSGHETSKFQITHHRFVHVYVYKVIIKHPRVAHLANNWRELKDLNN